eukprot:2885954-Rhodomonas_salina.3
MAQPTQHDFVARTHHRRLAAERHTLAAGEDRASRPASHVAFDPELAFHDQRRGVDRPDPRPIPALVPSHNHPAAQHPASPALRKHDTCAKVAGVAFDGCAVAN